MKRRGKGEGSIYQRPNGTWSALVHVTLPNGDDKRVSVTAKTYNEVRVKVRELLERKSRHIPYIEKEWTVSEYLDYWIKEVHPKRVRESTLETYERTIRCHIKPTLGGHKLKNLNVQNVMCALEELKNRGHSGRTGQKCLVILAACLKNAMREELIFRNVAKLVEKPKHTPKETAIWTSEQAVHFLETIKNHPQRIAFLLYLCYGMRRGEILGLRWCDVDFDKQLIHVRQQIGRVRGENKAWELKTKRSRRPLPLIDVVHDALINHAKKSGVIITKFNPCFELSEQDTIVISKAGTPLEPRNLERLFHNLRKKAGLPHIKPHATRNMITTALKELGVPDKDIQLILGHASIITTLDIYQHGTPEIQRAGISAVGEKLTGCELMANHL